MGDGDDTPPVDFDPGEWGADDARTQADGDAVPVPIDEPVTATHGIADMLEDARRRGYEQAAEHIVEQVQQTREEVIDVVRQLFMFFELQHPMWRGEDWKRAERWIRERLPPL